MTREQIKQSTIAAESIAQELARTVPSRWYTKQVIAPLALMLTIGGVELFLSDSSTKIVVSALGTASLLIFATSFIITFIWEGIEQSQVLVKHEHDAHSHSEVPPVFIMCILVLPLWVIAIFSLIYEKIKDNQTDSDYWFVKAATQHEQYLVPAAMLVVTLTVVCCMFAMIRRKRKLIVHLKAHILSIQTASPATNGNGKGEV